MAYEPPNEKRRGPGRPRKSETLKAAEKRHKSVLEDILGADDDDGQDEEFGTGLADGDEFASITIDAESNTGDTVQAQLVKILMAMARKSSTPPAVKLRAVSALYQITSKLPPPPPKDTVRGELVAFIDDLRRSRPLPESVDDALSGLTVDG